jgi:hypothetical protein
MGKVAHLDESALEAAFVIRQSIHKREQKNAALNVADRAEEAAASACGREETELYAVIPGTGAATKPSLKVFRRSCSTGSERTT